ncbi:hypothetical protein J1763_gp57 [Gordonia phage YorkOnyx]|uniref:Uncharacterized protein n=1 Tax=Gordonia phage YorkOnyx TaxID=2762402 RepID=A0A7G8LMA6_9CAUD|nr:hypothetical protein J1763_gp57 [Gordonia phage YorkOnyx]QNJ58378.1 hypothetical protein SEA_YORKONYX_57 [Gordonia phage YorkOnyx]
MTDHRTPRRTPRTDADELINRARTTDHLVDIPGIGAVATAAAILDLADAIRESNEPAVTNVDATEPDASTYVDVMFDGPPGPESGRFIEVENQHRASIRFGEWVEFPDGRWALRIHRSDVERIKPDVFDDDDDSDVGPPEPTCDAEGCGRVAGHEGVHLVAEPFTLPPITVQRGGVRYHHVLHTSEGGDTSAVARDVPDGSHIVGRAPATEPVSSPVQPPNGDADPLWRLRLLTGRARRAVGRVPLPPSRYTLGALVDDLDETVQQLIKSRDNCADA